MGLTRAYRAQGSILVHFILALDAPAPSVGHDIARHGKGATMQPQRHLSDIRYSKSMVEVLSLQENEMMRLVKWVHYFAVLTMFFATFSSPFSMSSDELTASFLFACPNNYCAVQKGSLFTYCPCKPPVQDRYRHPQPRLPNTILQRETHV